MKSPDRFLERPTGKKMKRERKEGKDEEGKATTSTTHEEGKE
jgi:hypothetical protein